MGENSTKEEGTLFFKKLVGLEAGLILLVKLFPILTKKLLNSSADCLYAEAICSPSCMSKRSVLAAFLIGKSLRSTFQICVELLFFLRSRS